MSPGRTPGLGRAAVRVLAGLWLLGAAVAQEPPKAPPVHDPANPDHLRLQAPAEAFAGLPRDQRGRVDWMKALRQGQIQPRADLKGEGGAKGMIVLSHDVVMKNTADMPHVKFPHESHTQWLACTNCHDELFVPKAGANPINMTKIFQGQYCGVCHDQVAFTTLFACERCHSVPHSGARPWW
ncbi:c(7)-type cytochrome triheme domain-containing protein [Ideonella sp. A 288]|uniref:c(7)-type cytochrome triheme domain-containing protein n=1 Tax=Ideonella sp. A 288 TaxID=1962181 RepID=UPI001303809C|nr:c(7)-type cytochrome triheme domain-containing protein [Ideonella sp. A 288]